MRLPGNGWYMRIGPDSLEGLLAEMIAVAIKTKTVSQRQLERITVDMTVQTKAVADLTDSHLTLRAIEWLNRAARRHDVKLRQSFQRLATWARREVDWLLHSRSHAQGLSWIRRQAQTLCAAHASGRMYPLPGRRCKALTRGGKGKAPTRYELGVKSPTIRHDMRRHSDIEHVVGHLKADGLLEQKYLAGPEGDTFNAILCAPGHYMRLLARWIRLLFALLIAVSLYTPSLNQQRNQNTVSV